MYVVLTGAKKNLGDYLITERAKALLERVKPGEELVEHPSWQPLDPAQTRAAKAVIILGGPGYQPSFHPGVYPLLPKLDDIGCPVFCMGMGWKGLPGDDASVESYRFSETSLQALRWVSQHSRWLGCRDPLSMDVLERAGVHNTLLTGCPVWYHLPSIGKPMRLPQRVERLVFTPPQKPLFAEQALRVASHLAELFAGSELIAAFHRGIDEDSEWLGPEEKQNNRRLADTLGAMGFETRDVSGSTEQVAFYDECQLHVGYRVHAHIQFCSQRLPSLLLHEDGRGRGASMALELRGIDAFERTLPGRVPKHLLPKRLNKLTRKLGPDYQADASVPERVLTCLRRDVETGFARYAGVGARIDAQLRVMRRFIESLP